MSPSKVNLQTQKVSFGIMHLTKDKTILGEISKEVIGTNLGTDKDLSSFGYEPNNTKGKLPAVDCDNYGNIVLAQSESMIFVIFSSSLSFPFQSSPVKKTTLVDSQAKDNGDRYHDRYLLDSHLCQKHAHSD
ncbi:hypothetical protein V6N13_147822 [Hibiscus sabdariffa]